MFTNIKINSFRSAEFSGFLYGLLSAFFYSLAAIFMRQLTELNSPFSLTICLKESFAAVFAVPFVLWGLYNGSISRHQWRFWGLLFGVSAAMQILGNMTYLWIFSVAGIAVGLSCIWTGGLLSAQLYDLFCLRERFNIRVFFGLIVILAAVVFIGIGMSLNDSTGTPSATAISTTWGGVLIIIFSGLLVGTMSSSTMAAVRYSRKNDVSFWVPILLVPGSGTVVLGIWSLIEHGSAIQTALTGEQLFYITLAGLANLAAFIALVKGLLIAPLAFMNLMNASQVALGALAGIFWFAEPSNGYIIAGVILTIVAILL